jgi:hypothetical protein
MTKQAAAGSNQLVSLPVIVRERELFPLDVYSFKGEMFPMDEADLQEIMTNSHMFSGVANPENFQSSGFTSQVTPPDSGRHYGGDVFSKNASANTLLKLAFEMAPAAKVAMITDRLRNDAPLRASFLSTEPLADFVSLALQHKEKTAADISAAVLEERTPYVVQIHHKGDGSYKVTSVYDGWVKVASEASRFEVADALTREDLELLYSRGFVTYALAAPGAQAVKEKVAADVSTFGEYQVWSDSGNSYSGIVIPNVVNIRGEVLPLQIFAALDSHAFQEKVAGVRVGDAQIPLVEPRGLGCLTYVRGNQAVGLEPVEVLSKFASPKGVRYLCKVASTGMEVTIVPVQGLGEVLPAGDNVYAIPSTFSFIPMGSRSIQVLPAELSNLMESTKVAGSAVRVSYRVEHDDFLLSGAMDLPRNPVQEDEAELLMCGLGLSGKAARELLKTASAKGQVRFVPSRSINPTGMPKLASASLKDFHAVIPKVNLLNEVAVLASSKASGLFKQAAANLQRETVDSILSLNFMTPENASVYVGFLPILEKTSSVLAELVVASRLGMDDVREAAALNAMTQVNSVVKGLTKLSEKIK